MPKSSCVGTCQGNDLESKHLNGPRHKRILLWKTRTCCVGPMVGRSVFPRQRVPAWLLAMGFELCEDDLPAQATHFVEVITVSGMGSSMMRGGGGMPALILRILNVNLAFFLHLSDGDSVTAPLNLACPRISTQPLWSRLQLRSHTAQNNSHQGELV